MTRGIFVTFEGMDGAGKSTQAAILAASLRARNKNVLETREPGGSDAGEKLRRLVMDSGGGLDGVTETLLMAAARREHLVRRICPALARGEWVVCDRFSDSTFAYQGGGRGVRREWIAEVLRETEDGVRPDITFYLQADADSASQPLLSAGDSFENRRISFYHAVDAEYRRLAKENPRRIIAVESFAMKKRRGKDEIAEEIYGAVAARFAGEFAK
ncbi:MAG: dTMP kinase [Gammaproteobacteria bacterium]